VPVFGDAAHGNEAGHAIRNEGNRLDIFIFFGIHGGGGKGEGGVAGGEGAVVAIGYFEKGTVERGTVEGRVGIEIGGPYAAGKFFEYARPHGAGDVRLKGKCCGGFELGVVENKAGCRYGR